MWSDLCYSVCFGICSVMFSDTCSAICHSFRHVFRCSNVCFGYNVFRLPALCMTHLPTFGSDMCSGTCSMYVFWRELAKGACLGEISDRSCHFITPLRPFAHLGPWKRPWVGGHEFFFVFWEVIDMTGGLRQSWTQSSLDMARQWPAI